MKVIKNLAGLVLMAVLAFEIASCSADPEIKYVEKEVEKTVYVCPKDKKEFDTAQEAAECCGVQVEYVEKKVEKTVYVCPKDKKEFDTAQEAAECCGVQVEYVEKKVEKTVYVCPKDKKEFATAQEAAECCGVQVEYVEKKVEKTVYVCPKDKKEFATAQEAAECCGVQIEYVSEVKEKFVYISELSEGTYTVYHCQQKVSGGKSVSDYVVETMESNKNVSAKSTIDDLKKNYTGFTAKALALNEKFLYIFYDRNTITYTFQTGSEGKLNDGKTERIVEGLYGANVAIPIAISSTHNFGGWFTSANEALTATFGENELTFTVKWTEKAAGGFDWYEIPVDAETGDAATPESRYVYFGVFPKTVLEEGGAIAVDETEMKVMGANTYYKGNDGNYYAKVTAEQYDDYKYSDGTKITSGAERYFRVEPIKWNVLTTDYNGTKKALLLAEEILTANVPYYVDDRSKREINGNTVYPNNYKYSTLRAYLNGKFEDEDTQEKTVYEGKGFLQTAFTSNARLLIADTVVNNAKETTGYGEDFYAVDYTCDNTEDKIFLLSMSEVKNEDYGFDSNLYRRDTRIKVTTDYAKANCAYQASDYGCGGYWWLRSPDYCYGSYHARDVDYVGKATDISVYNAFTGVVPALTISLQ